MAGTGNSSEQAEKSPGIAGSFSRLTIYESCPKQAYISFVEKRKQPEPPEGVIPPGVRGDLIHKALEAYVRGERDDMIAPLDKKDTKVKVRREIEQYREWFPKGNVSIEEEWAFDAEWQIVGWFDKNVALRVKLDVGVNHGNGLYEVVDYKSGKRFGNEVKHSQQGLLYAIATIMRFPDAENVVVKFIYVDQDQIVARSFTRAALVRLVPSWDNRFQAMRIAVAFPPKPSKIHCRFCPWAPKVNGGDGSCESGVEVPREEPRI